MYLSPPLPVDLFQPNFDNFPLEFHNFVRVGQLIYQAKLLEMEIKVFDSHDLISL